LSVFMISKIRKKTIVFIAIVVGVFMIAIFLSFLCKRMIEKPVEGHLVVNGQEWDETVSMTPTDVLVPLIPVLTGYGYSFDYRSEDNIIVTKNDCEYKLDLVALTFRRVKHPMYEEGDPVLDLNLLQPVVGAKKWHIERVNDDVIVNYYTILGLLEILGEKPRSGGSYEERLVVFERRDQ